MRRIVPFLYYSRSGRRVVVYGKPEQLHRPNYGGREITEYRIQQSNPGRSASRQVPMALMVCSNQRQSNRPDHNGREITNSSSRQECQTPCHHGGRFRGSMVYRMGANQIGRITCTGDITEYQSLPLRRTSWHNRGFGRRGLVRRGMRSDRPVYDSVLGLGENILLRP